MPGFSQLDHFVKTNPRLPGNIESHKIDVGVANGMRRFGAYGLSFELFDTSQLEHDYTKAVYAVADSQAHLPNFPIGVMVFPPTSESPSGVRKIYRRAQDSLPRAGAHLLMESEIDRWVNEQLDTIEADAHLSALFPVI